MVIEYVDETKHNFPTRVQQFTQIIMIYGNHISDIQILAQLSQVSQNSNMHKLSI